MSYLRFTPFRAAMITSNMNQFHPKCSPEAQGQLLAATWAEAQQAVAEAEAIIAGYMPEGTVHRG